MLRTYLDAGVLIAAARGNHPLSPQATGVLDDANREFVSSLYLKLEVLPKAVYNRRVTEAQIYEVFFLAVSEWANPSVPLGEEALRLGSRFGLQALDALHVAAALALKADEFVTTERATKPLFRVTGLKVISLESVIIPDDHLSQTPYRS